MLRRFAESRILAIDDNEANLALLRALLARAGLREIHTFTDPREALAHFDGIDPDLVLLDLHMPHMSGYDVLSELIERAAGAYMPILILTADPTKEATHKALNLGARDYLTKPFDTSEVVLRVRNLLETRHLYQTMRLHNVRLREQLNIYQSIEQMERQTWQSERESVERLLSDDLLEMHFQPIFDLVTRVPVGVEALARFPGSEYGPNHWFGVAASVGLGTELEIAAIKAALPVIERLPASGFVAVNVSPSALLSQQFQELCNETFCRRVVLELTEHVQVEDYDTVAMALLAFRSKGLRLAADDTGAGYAGFRHLLGLDPDIVKLDISLIHDIDHDVARRTLASALVRFASETGRTLVAEGKENESENNEVQELNVHWGQGFHLARPMSIEALDHWLASRSLTVPGPGQP